MKRGTIIFIVLVLALGGYALYTYIGANTMNAAREIEDNSFTIQLPRAFEEDEYGLYINESNEMFVEWYFYGNNTNTDLEGIARIIETSAFDQGDFVSSEEVRINGEKAWQSEYRTLSTGNDNIHYYYEGVMTIFKLENEFLVVDAYKWMEESVGINSSISEDDMQLLYDITDSINITDDDYGNLETESQTVYADKLALELTDEWEISDDEWGYYDYGYFVSYQFSGLRMWVDITEYNDENVSDLESIKEYADGTDVYTWIGDYTLKGEPAHVYAYNAYTSDGDIPYIYGVVAVSEHYMIDMYFYSYTDDYALSDDAVEGITGIITSAE